MSLYLDDFIFTLLHDLFASPWGSLDVNRHFGLWIFLLSWYLSGVYVNQLKIVFICLNIELINFNLVPHYREQKFETMGSNPGQWTGTTFLDGSDGYVLERGGFIYKSTETFLIIIPDSIMHTFIIHFLKVKNSYSWLLLLIRRA